MYLFSRPLPSDYSDTQPLEGRGLESWENALNDYEQCKSYVLDYKNYKPSSADPER